MNFSELTSKKTQLRDNYKTQFDLPKRPKILIAVCFTNNAITKEIIAGLEILPANFIVFGKDIKKIEAKNIAYQDSHDNFDMTGIDAIFCNCEDITLEKIMEMGVVPIVNEKNYLGKILGEFHPGRAEGNAYLYEDNSSWSAYYALVRYLENHKFPYDNRNLVKNVIGV